MGTLTPEAPAPNAVAPTPLVAKPRNRNHSFDLLRILFAIGVLLAHAPELTDGDPRREIFNRLTHSGVTFGGLGVDGFFLLSGFLIVQSWQHNPRLLDFLRNRILRIVPGYAVAAVLSTAVVGLLAPAVPHYFTHLDRGFLFSLLRLDSPKTPAVFPGLHYQVVNGALWTIPYEFRCYLLVALCGLCGILRRRRVWLGITILLLPFATSAGLRYHFQRNWFQAIAGETDAVFRLTATYFVGGCFFLFRHWIRFRPSYAAGAALALVAWGLVKPAHFELALITFGAYLLFYLAKAANSRLTWMSRFPDISYGIYVYGWPIEELWIWYHRGSPWIAFVVSALASVALGWLSWEMVERPMLKLKRKPVAKLPPK